MNNKRKLVEQKEVKEAIKTEDETSQTSETDENDDEDLLSSPFLKKDKDEEFKRGDVVLAKFRNHPYWPAIFRHYSPAKKKEKVKKARVHFLEIPTEHETKKRLLTVNVEKIKEYSKDEKEKLEQGSKNFEELSRCFERADEYRRKRVLGKMVDFFNIDDADDEDEDDEDDLDAGDVKDDILSEIECKYEDETQDDIKNDDEKEIPRTPKRLKPVAENESIDNSPIMSVIRESQPYLLQIMKGEVYSKRHETFFQGTTKSKNMLKWSSSFYTLRNNECEEIQTLLLHWFEKDNVLENVYPVSYVYDVWLPEVLIHAISRCKNMSRDDAEREYIIR